MTRSIWICALTLGLGIEVAAQADTWIDYTDLARWADGQTEWECEYYYFSPKKCRVVNRQSPGPAKVQESIDTLITAIEQDDYYLPLVALQAKLRINLAVMNQWIQDCPLHESPHWQDECTDLAWFSLAELVHRSDKLIEEFALLYVEQTEDDWDCPPDEAPESEYEKYDPQCWGTDLQDDEDELEYEELDLN